MNNLKVFHYLFLAFYFLCFSFGDELGLAESLGNVEGSKRRALNLRTNVNNIGVLPAAKMPTTYSTPIQQSRPQALTSRPSGYKNPLGLPQRQSIANLSYPKSPAISLMTQATSLPLGVPAFKPIPKAEARIQNDPKKIQNEFMKKSYSNEITFQNQLMNQTSSYNRPARLSPAPSNHQIFHKQTYSNVQSVPAFQAMPVSVSRISTGPIVQLDNKVEPTIKNSIMTIPGKDQQNNLKTQQVKAQGVDLMGHSIEELAAAANVSVAVIKEAIKVRQQEMWAQKQYEDQQAQLIQQQILSAQTTLRTTTTSTTTPKPRSKYPIHSGHKVMNAPKEYYPVGYDKNFDDNFVSKVDLPQTTFNCGDQKHFPGLYGDEDLGCMVFHVCALTDDGLIMKSFLCPESTLFDQTILKCNWWFYVDCKNSKSLYDSNLPVSKSYQLMKALSFFSSNYKNTQNVDGVDVEALKNSVSSNKAV